MGKHRQPRRTSSARFVMIRATTAMGVVGALAFVLQSGHDTPASRATPESLHSPLPDTAGSTTPPGGPDRAATAPRGPGAAPLSPSAAPRPTDLLPAGAPDLPRPVTGDGTPWAEVPAAPPAAPDQRPAPPLPVPTPAAGPAEPGPAPVPPGPGKPADAADPEDRQPAAPPEPTGPATTPIDVLADLLDGLMAPGTGSTTGTAADR
ncbi:hypothetical protein ACFPM3_04400 [Streptomyces coeruleoprunus]|uniref:Extensin n=1 Tax=Streptomyces coeruleoprunus TaxID=285563 RepID=A0ABV9XAW7_9ACTN